MSPKNPPPKFSLPSRTAAAAVADPDAAFRALEQRTEQRGNGVAGQPTAVSSAVLSAVSSDVQPPKKSIVTRRKGRVSRRRRTIYLPVDLDAALEQFCEERGREVSETVAGAVELYLASKR